MTKKTKNFLKCLRNFAHVFEDEKNKEITIGFPTDVKHVAHMGWDGPASAKPSWMDEYKGPQLTTEPLRSKKELSLIGTENNVPSTTQDANQNHPKEPVKESKHSHNTQDHLQKHDGASGPRHSQRRKSSDREQKMEKHSRMKGGGGRGGRDCSLMGACYRSPTSK